MDQCPEDPGQTSGSLFAAFLAARIGILTLDLDFWLLISGS
jgi:hypothetical protein